MYSVCYQLFTETCFNRLRRCCWCSSDILPFYSYLGRDRSYFVHNHSDSTKKLSETDIIIMIEFLSDNIFVMSVGRACQQRVGISMGTNCIPLLSELFLYSYMADFIQGILKKNGKKLSWSFNFTFSDIDNVLSLSNFKLGEYVVV